MQYLKIDGNPVSVFDICQAHLQLESDYNKDGILIERPSNQRRNASTGVQLNRMKFHNGFRWVDICAEESNDEDEDVRMIYMENVLKWNLPMDNDLKKAINRYFAQDYLQRVYPHAALETPIESQKS